MTTRLAWPSAERLPRVLVSSAVAYTVALAALHLLWMLTGSGSWMAAFTSLISVFFVLATGLSVVLSIAARRYFSASDPLRPAWTLLVVASAIRLTGHVIRHVLGHGAFVDAPSAAYFVHLGQVVAGPIHSALVAVALARVMHVCGRLRLLVRPTAFDMALGGATAFFAVRFLYDLSTWYAASSTPSTVLDALSWTNDPLLALLLIEAIVLRRAAVAMGAGVVARVWGTFATAIFLSTIGDLSVWAQAHQYLNWPWTSLFWYVWPAVEAAWALGPAWQVIACRAAEQHALVTLPSRRSSGGVIAFDGHPGSIDITPGPA